MMSSLARAVRAHVSSSIALIGAGGKTTAMFQVARELSDQGASPVIVTATTHLGAWQIAEADRHIIAENPAPIEELEHGLNGVILITGELDGDRTRPIKDNLLHWLAQYCGYHAVPLLLEADGSRGKPLKAWAEHEPPVPGFVDLVIQVVGLTGLGKPLNDESIHRSRIFAELSRQSTDDIVTADAVLRVLTNIQGGLKNLPAHARRIVLLNQADTPELQALAQGMAKPLLSSYDGVVVASLQKQKIYAVHEAIAGIVLAAGASTRFGQPKQLLDWRGEPFVKAVARKAVEAGLLPITVVTGANALQVESTLQGLPLTIARNDDWQSGQASSIRAGVRLLPRHVGAAIFLLADQPQVTASILRALAERHAEGLHPVVAPMVMDQRANPVLFDRVTFGDLLTLEGDVGGRAVFHKHRVEYLPWHDDRLLLDVDTPEMYRRLTSEESL